MKPSKRMSKPQKTRKHSKIRAIETLDPYSNSSETRNSDEDLPPTNENDEKVPNSMKEFLYLKNRKKDKKKKRLMERGCTRPMREVPEFKRKAGESEYQFMARVERTTQLVLAKSRMEDAFDVDIEDNSELPALEMVQNRKAKTKSKAKSLKRLESKKKLKQIKLKEKKQIDFGELRDDVTFGDVAQQPPMLTAKPRKAQKDVDARPGKKALLLKEMLHSTQASRSSSQHGSVLSLSRPEVCPARQVMLNAERERAVQVYRLMKAQQRQRSETH